MFRKTTKATEGNGFEKQDEESRTFIKTQEFSRQMSGFEGRQNINLKSSVEVVRGEVKFNLHADTQSVLYSSHSPKLQAISVDESVDK